MSETAELQKELDTQYPFGGTATRIDDVPEGIGVDNSTQFLTPRVRVLGDDNPPTLQMLVIGAERDVRLTMVSMEETSPGVTIFHTPDDEPDYMITRNVDPAVEQSLREARAEEYGDEV